MKKFPEIESNFGELSNIFFSIVSSRLLITAIYLKVFDCLEEAVSAAEVSKRLATDPANTTHMLDGLCALGLIDKNNKKYRNKKIAYELLITGKPAYLGDWFLQTDKDFKPYLDMLPEIISSGPEAIARPDHMNSAENCEKFTASHAASSFAGVARDIARHVSSLPSFKNCRKMLDIGGGPGVNAMAVVRENENLEATVFDRPDIVHMADRYIQEYGFSDRVKTLGGDYLKDPVGSEYDMIMITDSLYYTDPEIDTVLHKCREALKPGGFFVGIHCVLTDERTRPSNMVIGMLPETVMNSGSLPDKGFLIKALERCGFTNISSEMVMIGDSLFEMNAGYKVS